MTASAGGTRRVGRYLTHCGGPARLAAGKLRRLFGNPLGLASSLTISDRCTYPAVAIGVMIGTVANRRPFLQGTTSFSRKNRRPVSSATQKPGLGGVFHDYRR